MTPRKIRMTAVESDTPSAFSALLVLSEYAGDDIREAADRHGSYADKIAADEVVAAVEAGWDDALTAAEANDVEKIRAALQRAHAAALAAGYSTEHEDAALAMLPPVAGRRAA